jgi:hypothetical protein
MTWAMVHFILKIKILKFTNLYVHIPGQFQKEI